MLRHARRWPRTPRAPALRAPYRGPDARMRRRWPAPDSAPPCCRHRLRCRTPAAPDRPRVPGHRQGFRCARRKARCPAGRARGHAGHLRTRASNRLHRHAAHAPMRRHRPARRVGRRKAVEAARARCGASLRAWWWASLRQRTGRWRADAWRQAMADPPRAAARGGQRNRLPRTALNSCLCPLLLGLEFLDPAIAPFFELQRQLFAARAYDSTTGEHMHVIGHDVIKQTLIVSDDDHGALRRAQAVHAVGHDTQGIDVEPGVGFVEHRELGLEQRHLEHFIALFLAARKAFVHRAIQELFAHADGLHFFLDALEKIHRVEFIEALMAAHGVDRGTQEVGVGDAWNLDRILESQENAGPGALFDGHLEQILTQPLDRTAVDTIVFTACQYLGQRALAGAV